MDDLLAIFDVDGTLVDSQGAIHATMSRAFDEVGLTPPDRAAVLSRVGLSLPLMIADLLGPDRDRLDDVLDGYRHAYFAMLEAGGEPPLFDGVREGIDRLRAGHVTLGIATGKSKRGLDQLIEAQGWRGVFVTMQCADFHPSKPHPSMIQRALLETAIESQDAVMIGDTTFDMEMAGHADVAAIGVDWGYHPADRLMAAGAEVVLSTFDAVVDHLEGLRP